MKVHYESRLARILLPKRFIAITLGERVLTPLACLSEATLRHEQVHIDQWKRHGLWFPFLYVWYHIQHGYHRNPFEREARAAERENGTRTGGEAPPNSRRR